MSALEDNDIDYILKPPLEEDVSRALRKIQKTAKAFFK
jgi:hypothetical protein